MKRILMVAVTAVATVMLPLDNIDAQRRIVPFLGGGLASGSGDLSDNTDHGWHVFGGADFPLGITPGLSFGVTASYTHIPYTESFDEAMNIPAVFGELGYLAFANSTSIVKPYVRAGAGVQVRRYDPGSTGFRNQSEARLAFTAGGGLQLDVATTAVFVGAQFMSDANAGVLAFNGGVAIPIRPR
jgi:opacity protein-like surface antigen